MARGGEAMQGLGQGGGAMQGLGQAPSQGMGGLGQGAGQAMPGIGSGAPAGSGAGAGGPSNFATPASPGQAGMGAPGSPGAGIAQPPSAPPSGPMGGAAPPSAPPSPPLPQAPQAVAQPTGPSWPLPGAGEAVSGGSKIGGTIIKVVLGGIGVIGGVVIGGVVLGGILVFTGDPEPCVERSPAASDGAVTALFERWNAFKDEAQSGPATVTFSEDEATSRAQQYLNEKDIPLNNAQVFFCPDGRGQVKGRVSALGRDINILLEGHVDASQQPPVIVIDEIKAGNLPSQVAETIVGDRLDRNNVKTLNFGIPISAVDVADGQVTLESPGP
jgi:hypothetical protein